MNRQEKTSFWMEFISDFICLFIANIFSFVVFHDIFQKILDYTECDWINYFCVVTASFLVIFTGFHYRINIHKRNRWAEFFSVFKNSVLTYLLLGSMLIVLKIPIIDSRYMLVSSFIGFTVLCCISRYIIKRVVTGRYTKSKNAAIAGIITTSEIASDFVESVQKDWSLRVTGIALLNNYFNKNSSAETSSVALKEKTKIVDSICDVPVVATDENFIDWIRSSPLDEVFINIPSFDSNIMHPVVEELEDMGITVHINIPSIDRFIDSSKFNNISCNTFGGNLVATFKPTEKNSTLLVFKRIFDIVVGLIGCLISLPIILITAIPLLIESPGPLIFKQQRVGKNGRLFYIYKLRSMYVDAEQRKAELMKNNKMNGFMFKMDDDPRITKVGKFIRKYSIDELPQFWNVVKGDMSLVGTRPPTIDEFEKYESRHKRRLSMRPGISGMWQVSGRSDIQDFEEVVKLDCKYIDEWSIGLDIKILFKTVKVVLTHEGAE